MSINLNIRNWVRTWRDLRKKQVGAAPGCGFQCPNSSFLERWLEMDGSTYHYRVYVPPNWSCHAAWPVILFLHGGGGYGNDNTKQTTEGLGPAIARHPERFPAIVVFPQIPADGNPGWQGKGGRLALATLDHAIEEFRGDVTRVVLTGLSIGGNGAWYLAYHHPERFSGLLVVCGFITERLGTMYPILYPSLIPSVKEPAAGVAQRIAHIPTWIFHGDADPTVSVEHSRRMAAALRAADGPMRYTELPGVEHDAWDDAYNRREVARWLLEPAARC